MLQASTTLVSTDTPAQTTSEFASKVGCKPHVRTTEVRQARPSRLYRSGSLTSLEPPAFPKFGYSNTCLITAERALNRHCAVMQQFLACRASFSESLSSQMPADLHLESSHTSWATRLVLVKRAVHAIDDVELT